MADTLSSNSIPGYQPARAGVKGHKLATNDPLSPESQRILDERMA
jgi:hypothetical protein